tara:strand:+ start:769 stop:1290 length:522 start_codon:yes stop_codon:yes gene_type:complete
MKSINNLSILLGTAIIRFVCERFKTFQKELYTFWASMRSFKQILGGLHKDPGMLFVLFFVVLPMVCYLIFLVHIYEVIDVVSIFEYLFPPELKVPQDQVALQEYHVALQKYQVAMQQQYDQQYKLARPVEVVFDDSVTWSEIREILDVEIIPHYVVNVGIVVGTAYLIIKALS